MVSRVWGWRRADEGACFWGFRRVPNMIQLKGYWSLGIRGFGLQYGFVAEWIHFTLFGIILPIIKLKVYTFWGL